MSQKFIHMSLEEALTPGRHADFLCLLKIPAIANALDMGGWIAGGLPRHLLLDLPLTEYFGEDSNRRAGDVDIFFANIDEANRAAAFEESLQSSYGGFALEAQARFAHRTLKVQFVNHPDKVYQSVEGTLENFDFLNCMVGLTRDKLVVAKGWHEAEAAKLLKICNATSPFLGSRINKYLTKRGLENISPDSQENLTAWLCRASNQDYSGITQKHASGLQYAVKTLADLGHIRREDFLFFIGKYQMFVKERAYGETKVFDWALHHIGESTSNNLMNV